MSDRLLVFTLFVLVVAMLVLWVSTRPRALNARLKQSGWPAPLRPLGRPTILAFTSPDCAVCQTAQRPALDELKARTAGQVEVQEVDVLTARDVARVFGIVTVPSTVVVDDGGQVVAFNIGVASANTLFDQLQRRRIGHA